MCICYLLLGGYNYLYTGSHPNAYPPELHFEKSATKFTDKKQGYPVVRETSADGAAYIIPEIEEDYTNNLSARKFKAASNFYDFSDSFVLIHHYSRFKSTRPYYKLLTSKYITQRVLRI
ncbi:hypothetical protein A3860_08165 [Niastella vici]|uniref:Uncharacterized protein n=1 Tax=Niastella vici TaxID=1703345 RepID=A0A1V9FIT9_9BACT|nr:hypothetical protein A3860_08165 [Niastella vici]